MSDLLSLELEEDDKELSSEEIAIIHKGNDADSLTDAEIEYINNFDLSRLMN